MLVSKHAEFDPQPPTRVCIVRNSDKEKQSAHAKPQKHGKFTQDTDIH